jgi:uncharacterized damage-inducible protein DinB
MSRLQQAIDALRTARLYTKELLKHMADEDWFRQPSEGVTHVGWQVGHLAICEYMLTMKRIRGERPSDGEIIPENFVSLFGKGSTPQPNASAYPAPEELRAVLDRVHKRAVQELNELPESAVDDPIGGPPHPMFKTKLDAVHWCARHEFIHAGQIGLIRRLLGAAPLR